jgi:Kelch motif
MSTPRELHTATLLLGSKVLVTGGDSSNSVSRSGPVTINVLKSAELYDPTVGTWSTTASMSTLRE